MPPLILDVLQALGDAMSSAFAVAFIGGLTGAFGGALGAQHIAERAKRREQLLAELRHTNAATMAAFSICNGALATKVQHVLPMHRQFSQDKAAIQAHIEQNTSSPVSGSTFHFVADLKTFPAPEAPIEVLKELVFHRISAYGRPLALVSVLEQSLTGLKAAVLKRDFLIEQIKQRSIPQSELPNFYFGFPLPGGDTNQEFADTVEAIRSYVDDLVFFSALLCADLVDHGKRVRDVYAKQFKKGAPRVSTPDFSGPKAKGLIPPDTEYADWLKAFVVADLKGTR